MPGTCPPPQLSQMYDVSACIFQNPGSSCFVQCDAAFGWFGVPEQYNCTIAETYVGTPPVCATTTSTSTLTTTRTELVVCTDGLPTEVGVDVSDCAGQVVSGQRCVVRCATNFFGTAEDYICNPFTARFEGAPMVCSRQSCGSLVSVPGRTDVNTSACKDVVVGDFCLVSCKEGYVPADASYQCVSDLSYQGTAPTCTRMPCNTATLPASAGLDVSSCYNLFVGDTCTASCLPGYLGTAAQMQCELSTDFTGTAPNCILKDCLVPPFWKQEPSFNTTCDGAKHGSTCIASCQLGYSGQSQQFACDNGQLRGQIPSCAPGNPSRSSLVGGPSRGKTRDHRPVK
ncbi:unnamed protein product [Effrenium voratum]|uniref:Sushi domain-containing protein n=1 Tax=Effrenium voratum TaxID=2562239 RepID=A0AA36NKX0_9DINO|nr:unnamed protein product [Effrenium voratum]